LKRAAHQKGDEMHRDEIQHDRADDFEHVESNAQHPGDHRPRCARERAGKHDERQR
jgi:hypothetical protein